MLVIRLLCNYNRDEQIRPGLLNSKINFKYESNAILEKSRKIQKNTEKSGLIQFYPAGLDFC